MSLLTSRRVWIGVFGVLAIALEELLGLELPEALIEQFALLVVGLIVSLGITRHPTD